jgi:eukaryotic-like serine/threonine-protein kinase
VRAVITDFGLARTVGAAERNPSAAVLAGTPDYMAPELWKGAKPSVASDIYALGVILWELGSGRKPSELGMTSATLPWGEHLSWKPPPARGKWSRVVARCLDPDPKKRFASAEEVTEALGPSANRKRLFGVTAAALLAIGSGVITYRSAVPRPEIVRLAMMAFESGANEAPLAAKLIRDTSPQLAQLKGNAKIKFTVLPQAVTLPDESKVINWIRPPLRATHALQGTLKRDHAQFVLNVHLTDLRSGADAKEWSAEYAPAELRYAPIALVGIVSETLHLPPLGGVVKTNERARQDYRKGLLCLRSETTAEAAIASMTKAVAADPDSPLTYSGLAEAQWLKYHATKDRKFLSQAVESARRAEYRNPDLAEVHLISGQLKKEAGSYEAAMVEYRRAIELQPRNGEGYRRLGIVHRSNNQLDESLMDFRKAVEVAPQDFRIYLDLGALYFYRGEYGEAVKHFRKAIEIAPNEPKARFNLANVCLNMGQYDKAEREIREAIRLAEIPSSLETLGLVLMYQQKERAAIPFFLRAANLTPDQYIDWLHLGTCYRRTKQAAKATRAYQRGLQAAELEMARNPYDGRVRSSLAYLCINLGQRLRANSEIEQALRLSPNNAETQFMAVLTYETLRRRDETLTLLRTAPAGTVADLGRWPDLADLHQDPRFLGLLTIRGIR